MMNRTTRWAQALALSTLVLVSGLQNAAAEEAKASPDFLTILKSIDRRSTFDGTDFTATETMTNVDPDTGTTVRKATMFRRDKDDAFLMLTLEPIASKGKGTLRVDSNVWVYDPVSRKFTHTTLKDTYEGTSARNSDFRKSTTADDYNVDSYTEGKLGTFDCWIVELKGKTDEVTFPYMKMWVRKDNNLILKTENYSLTKKLLRTALYPKYAKVGEKYVPTTTIFIDGLVPGKKTQIDITSISTDPLPNEVFTKAYLERVNK